ncbi:DNA-binding protein [bacterium]|nr:MAG: DNA-binding protein [bacterium]RKZ17426.1 MAG: DNA-binding protein [bacterium]
MQARGRCVCFGSSRTDAQGPGAALAHACGAELARLGWTVMSGGYEGSMGAVSRGASEAGGRVIGVTTPIFSTREANPALDEELSEADYPARMATLLRQGQAYLGLPGGLGTLSECLAAWCLATIGQLGGPLVLFRNPWEPVVGRILELEEVAHDSDAVIRWIDSPDELAAALAGR